MSQTELRVVLAFLGAFVLLALYWFGRPKKAQPFRTEPQLMGQQKGQTSRMSADADASVAQQFGPADGYADPDAEAPSDWQAEQLETRRSGSNADMPEPGTRADLDFDMIVSLHVMARDGGEFSGPELTVAAEKTSLVYGAQGLFHRLPDSAGAVEPVFSMVNRVMPGSFDLSDMLELRTPGVSFFMTLPNPLSALEAWDKLLPAAQRMAGLLNADICDEEMNLLGRQRIAAIREDMRNYDRKTGRAVR